MIRRIASVEGRAARLALWAEAFRARPPADTAQALDGAVRGAALRDAAAVAAYLPLLDLPALAEAAGPGRLAEVLWAVRGAGLEGALLLLEHPGRPVAPEKLGPSPDPVLESLTLGHRRTAARGGRSPVLDRLLRDPDPRVVAEVLRNPRLRESEVLAIASRRPCPEAVFRLLAASEAWIRRPAVQEALVRNPHAPPQLAVGLAVLLPGGTLADVADENGLHPAVRDGARTVLRWRETRGRGPSGAGG